MTDLCASLHPQFPSVLCDKPRPCWTYHASASAQMTWEGTPLPPSSEPSKKDGSIKGKLALIAKRAR